MSKKVELPKKDESGAEIDYLEEDPELPNQRYVVVSFLSPEKILEDKQQFFFSKFMQWADYDWKVKGMEHFVHFLSKKYALNIDDIMKDVREFEQTHKEEIKKTDIPDKYQTFLLKHEKEVQAAFDTEVEFQCNIRGVKVRRAFPSYEEAQLWCKVLQRKYPKDNIIIGKMGCWLPWEPSEHLLENVEYANSQLNEIMRRYKENEANRELFFAEEREAAIKAQKEENEKRKLENAKAEEEKKKSSAMALMDAPAVHPSEGAVRDA